MQWALLEPYLPPRKKTGRPREISLRDVLNAIFYLLQTGCSWRMLPHDFPPHQTVYEYFAAWRKNSLWETINCRLREAVRKEVGREPDPEITVVDAQSVKSCALL